MIDRYQSSIFKISLIVLSLSLVSLLVPLQSAYGAAVTFDFPTTPGVFQPTHAPDGGDGDGFVLMFSAPMSPVRNLRISP